MIIGIIHKGSGLGDQLFSYIATRVGALDLGVDFGFVGKEFFKGKDFMNLDWGEDTYMRYRFEELSGKLVIDDPLLAPFKLFEINKPYYDPEFNFIEDGAVIDGYGAQDIRYFEHRLDEIREWLKVEPLNMLDDVCVINFRGGEFTVIPELFLTQEYWVNAMQMMKEKHPKIRFEVHTDDPKTAEQFFPSLPIVQDVGLNWRAVRYAKHLIISNSAFAILPALLGDAEDIIAPKYWNRRNVGRWDWPMNYYKKFQYI